MIGDSQDPVWRWSALNAYSSTGVSGRTPKGPLAVLQEGLNRMAGLIPPVRLPHSIHCITSYMEQQVLASKALLSSQEYVHWLHEYVTFLCSHGKKFFIIISFHQIMYFKLAHN